MIKIFLFLSVLLSMFFSFWNEAWATGTLYYFETPTVLEGINTTSLEETPTISELDFTYNSSSGTIEKYETLDYTNHLNSIIFILYQILLVIFFVGFFHLVWIFYTFFNDILWKR